jgi:hypothetical protein
MISPKELKEWFTFLKPAWLRAQRLLRSRGPTIMRQVKATVGTRMKSIFLSLRRRVLLLVLLSSLAVLLMVGIRIWRREVIIVAGPSGKMGDIGDIEILPAADADCFKYETIGRGPHKWEWKYDLEDQPAQFGGVMYLQPPDNWGNDPNGGLDLRRVESVLRWEARSLGQEAYVEFVIGGINWNLDDQQRKKVAVPYPDSMPRRSLGTKRLTSKWQRFSEDLKKRGLDKEDYFRGVIGVFGWVINWAPNGIELDEKAKGSNRAKTFKIEIRNIRYERR